MAKDKASTRKPRRRNARARDDGGTRRATEATPPVRASKRLSVQVSAAASAFLVNFRLRMDAIASIFVNYHEERQEFVAKTEAADLIEQNVAELMQLCYRGASAGEFEIRTFPPGASRGPSRSPRRARPTIASARASEPCTEWKDDASAEDEGRSRKHLSARGAATPPDGFGATSIPRRSRLARRVASFHWGNLPLLIQFVVLPRKMGTGRDSLETDENVVTCFIDGAATLKRARKQGLLRPVAPRPLNARRADVVASERPIAVARGARHGPLELPRPVRSIPDDLDPVARRLQFDFVLMLCRRLGVKDVFLFATEAGAPAWLTLGFEHVGSSASLIHLRFDLLFKRDRGVLARSARGPPSRSVAEYGEKQVVRLAKEAANAAAEVEAENDDESRPRSTSGGAAPRAVTQEQERNAFLERIQAEEVRREQARIAAARPVPPPPNRATGAGDDSDEGWEESDDDDPVEDLIHRERIRERDLLRTPGCLALGRKAFRLEDMPRVTERDREILRRVLYILREAERRNCGELEVPRPREWANSELGDTMTTEAIRARFDLRRDDGVFLRLQRLFPNLDFRLSWSVRFNVVVQTIDAIALDSNLELTRDMEVRRSTVGVYEDSLACQLLGQTYYVHPDKTIKITVDLVVTSEVIGAFRAATAVVPRSRSLDDGHLIVELKYLQAMHVKNRMLKKCCYTLYLLELADRLRGEASRETLKTARKNVVEAEGEYQLALSNYRQMELWCFFKLDMALLARPTLAGVIRKFANAIARKAAEARGETFVPTPYDETAVDAVVVTAVPPVAPSSREPAAAVAAMDATPASATLVADGAKKVVFQYGRPGNGTDYLVALARPRRRTRCASSSTSSRRDVAAAAADELPVDRLQRAPDPGLVNLPTIWPRMRFPSASRLAPATGFSRVRRRSGRWRTPSEFMPTAASTAAVANFYRDPCGLLEPRALAPPGQPRRVAKLYVVPNCEVVSPPPPPIYHVTENGERLLVLYATRVQRPLIPAIQQVHKQRAEFLSLFDESEVEMAAAMFDSRPIEIARPLLFESEEDAERRAEPSGASASREEEAQGPVEPRTTTHPKLLSTNPTA
ncbi:hypothetical protein JL721_12847 [Aureococcus anophagefferens]|nr:hypothetical protein JL721_12847 [Aureococcus anophagefferens]